MSTALVPLCSVPKQLTHLQVIQCWGRGGVGGGRGFGVGSQGRFGAVGYVSAWLGM